MTACTHGQPLWHHLAVGDLCPVCRTIIVAAAAPPACGHREGVTVTGPSQAAHGRSPLAIIATGVAAHRKGADGPPPVVPAPVATIADPAPTTATPCPDPLSAAGGISQRQRAQGAGSALAARLTDPDTAHDAAAAVTDVQRRNVYRAVLEAIVEHGPCTDHDLARYVSGKLGHPIGQTSVGVRRGELRNAGLVADSGHKGRTETGAKAIRWALTPAGIDAAGGVAA